MRLTPEQIAERLSPDRLETMDNVDQIVYYELVGLPAARRSGDPRSLAGVLSNLTLAYAYEHRYPEARAYAAEARAVFAELGDHNGLISTEINLGVAHATTRHWTEAGDAYAEAFAGASRHAEHDLAVRAARNLATLYKQQPDLPGAQPRLAELARYAEEQGNLLLAVHVAVAEASISGTRDSWLAALELACAADDPQWIEIADRLTPQQILTSPAGQPYRQRLQQAYLTSQRLGYHDEAAELRQRLAAL